MVEMASFWVMSYPTVNWVLAAAGLNATQSWLDLKNCRVYPLESCISSMWRGILKLVEARGPRLNMLLLEVRYVHDASKTSNQYFIHAFKQRNGSRFDPSVLLLCRSSVSHWRLRQQKSYQISSCKVTCDQAFFFQRRAKEKQRETRPSVGGQSGFSQARKKRFPDRRLSRCYTFAFLRKNNA